MKAILERAAKAGRAQLLVAGFASSRPDRVVWADRKWEWAALRYENGDFELQNYFLHQAGLFVTRTPPHVPKREQLFRFITSEFESSHRTRTAAMRAAAADA
jgi:hypothetical protein